MIRLRLSNNSHEKQFEQHDKVSEGVQETHNITVNRDGDYLDFDFDQEISRHRSKLRVLYHAATCPCNKSSRCPSGVVHCCASKRLFEHIVTCTFGDDCDVPGCQHSRRVWMHYRTCRNANNASFTTKTCDICSAVPIRHDALLLCDRFQTEKSLCKRATTRTNSDTCATTDGENTSVDNGYFETWRAKTQDRLEEHDCLPVWRKRNLLHAQQQLLLPSPHGKENNTSSTNFTAENNHCGGGSDIRAVLHASNLSLNHSVNRNRVVRLDRNRHSASDYFINTPNHQEFDVLDGRARDLSFRVPSGSAVPFRLPVHPRDAKRKSRSAVESITSRS